MMLWASSQTSSAGEDGEEPPSTNFSGSSKDDHFVARYFEYAAKSDHTNFLTIEEHLKLGAFKDFCREHGYCDSLKDGQSTVDDITLWRFLRAQDFNNNKAFDQLSFVQDWRKKHAIEESYLHMDVQCYEDYRQMFSQWTGRRDQQGLPVYVFPMKHFTRETMDAYNSKYNSAASEKSTPTSELPCHIISFHALYENMLKFVMPLCSQLPRPHTDIPVSASTHIIDITDVNFAHFWKIKNYLQGAISIASTHYPETLGHIFVVGGPPSFATAWRMIKKWFDPASVSKIQILSPSETKTQLLNYIDLHNLPMQYGGTLSWNWGDMPDLEEPVREIAPGLLRRDTNGDEQYLKGPVIFSGGFVHVWGTVNGDLRRQGTDC